MKNFTNIIFTFAKTCYMMVMIPYEIVIVTVGLISMALMKIPKKWIKQEDIDAVEGLFLAAESVPLVIIGVGRIDLPENVQNLVDGKECIDVKGDFDRNWKKFKQWLKGS
jgi:hypothetical protein